MGRAGGFCSPAKSSIRMSLVFRGIGLFVFFGLIALRISIGKYLTVKNLTDESIHASHRIARLDEGDHNSFVFVHISDLHISNFADPERYEQLKEFCHINLNAIKPRVVLASGDLTDAIAPDRVIATQYQEEWQMYQDFYTSCQNETGIANWLDLRGNHDNFNVDGYNSSNSYYPKFGSQRVQEPGSYMVTVEANNNTKYAFIGVDATLVIGPKRILNFVGELDDVRLSKLEKFRKSAAESNVNATIWFGHYPSSSIFSNGLLPGLRYVASKGIAYLCGHFHTFGGIVPHMYSHHHSGMLELELADWKHNRMYRVGVLDQGLFSFADVQHKSWPVIVVTNPKPLMTVQPLKEPAGSMADSTHIRIFIFSPLPVEVCEVRLNQGAWQACKLTGKSHPLFTVPWQPALYADGQHVLQVRAKDSSGAESITQIDFALDKSRPDFPFLARLALMTDLTTTCQAFFVISIILSTVPFFFIRYAQSKIISRQMTLYRFRNRCIRAWVRRMWIFANINSIIYPFIIYTIYLAIGPWFFGHLIDGRIGVVFVWGTYFEGGIFLPGTLTYFYGFAHILFFNGVLILIVGYTADVSFQEVILKVQVGNQPLWKKLARHIPIVSFLAIHTFTCYVFWLSYGSVATFINPMRSWSLVFALLLWIKAKQLNESDLVNVAKTWNQIF